MITSLIAVRQRVFSLLGMLSMYRTVLLALLALAVIALVLSFTGLVGVNPLALLSSLLVLAAAVAVVDAIGQRVVRRAWRVESSLITALILLFVLQPGTSLAELGSLAVAGAVAALSKYVIVWRGRHFLNPAAVGATVVTLAGIGTFSSWWVGTPALVVPVALLGLVVLWRTSRVRIVALFVLVAVATALVRDVTISAQFGLAFSAGESLTLALLQSPVLFLGAFMLSEPLTLPPRRWQQFTVATVVGVLVGWPILVGGFVTLGQERALLIGNLLAFALALRGGLRLTLAGRRLVTPTVHELTFQVEGRPRIIAGQYVELEVPHARPDVRGTRREFSILSSPSDLPELRVAYRDGTQQHPSSYKRALGQVGVGQSLRATGVWGDFVLPRGEAPVLLVAAGIGVTPFVSQLRELRAQGGDRDIVLVYVTAESAELAFRDELERCGVRVIVFTRDEPQELPASWMWAGGARLDGPQLARLVPDLVERHVLLSGPPRLIADLAPELRTARSVRTDAFAGY